MEDKAQRFRITLDQLRESLDVLRAGEVEVRSREFMLQAEAESNVIRNDIRCQADARTAQICGGMERRFEEQTVQMKENMRAGTSEMLLSC